MNLIDHIQRIFILLWLPLIAYKQRSTIWLLPVWTIMSRSQFVIPSRPHVHFALLAWGWVSLCWTPNPVRATSALTLLTLFCFLRPKREIKCKSNDIIIAMFLGLIALILARKYHPGFDHKSTAALLAPIGLTAALLCAAFPGWITIGLGLLISWQSDVDTAFLLILCVAIGRHIPLIWLQRAWYWVCFLCGLISISFVSFGPQQINQINHYVPVFSYIHRIHIYKNIMNEITQRQGIERQIGCGFDSSRHHKGSMEFDFFEKDGRTTHHTSAIIPLHPHNGFLQIWYELGWIGLILGLMSLHSLSFQTREQALVAYVALGIYLMNVGLWQTWLLATLWMIFAMIYKPKTTAKSC